MRTVYIGMGGNLPSWAGPPETTLATAALWIESMGRVVCRSSLYSTEPVGFAGQPRFTNAVVELETELEANDLLERLLGIEAEFGRNRETGFANGPRTLDLDILLFGNQKISEPGLEIPHPHLAERAFVLVPLNEIAPTPSIHEAVRPWHNCLRVYSPSVKAKLMRWSRWKAMVGALALLATPLCTVRLSAQSAATLTMEDSSGVVLVGAAVNDSQGKLLGRTGADGRLTIACAVPCRLRVTAVGFSERTFELTADTTIRLEPAAVAEKVTVTAYRAPLGSPESPVTTRLLSEKALNTTATITLDDELRQLPGVELFRRSSSLVANPTSQGISLRGLGSTSASRTLLTEDDVPLNDPLGGWIHWQEEPELAVLSIELMRGGASDLYGSSAIGGVVSVIPARPTADMFDLRSSYGGEETFDDSCWGQMKRGPWGVLAAGGALGTDGYIQEAPSQRGPVDQASNVHSQNGLLTAEHDGGPLRLFVRGSGFNELRHNGTPYQFNRTRLWRYAAGGDWQGPHEASLVTRVYGSDERYRQTFSSISNLPDFGDPACSYRCGEIPTRFSFVPNNELGAAVQWNQPLGAGLLIVAGADAHDVRIWDREQSLRKLPRADQSARPPAGLGRLR